MEHYLFKSYRYQGFRVRRGDMKLTRELNVSLTGDPKLNGFFSKPLYSTSKTLGKSFILTRGTKNKILTATTELTVQARHLGGNKYEYELTARRDQSVMNQTYKTEGSWNFLGVPAEAAKRPSMIEQLVIHRPVYPFTLTSSDTKYKLSNSNFSYFISNSLGMLHLDDEERVKKAISRFCQPALDNEARVKACREFKSRIDAEVQTMIYFTRYKLNNPTRVTEEEDQLVNAHWKFFRSAVLDSLIDICESSKLTPKEQKAIALLKKNLAAIEAGVTSKEQMVNSYQQGDIIPIFNAFERELPGWNPELPWRYSSEDLVAPDEAIGNTVQGFFWSYDKIYTNIHTCILNSILVNRNSQLISYSIVGKNSDRLSDMYSSNRCVISHRGVSLKMETGAVYWKPESFSDAHYKKIEGDFKTDYLTVKQDGFVFSVGYEKKSTIIKISDYASHPKVFACNFGATLISHIPTQPGDYFLYTEGGGQLCSGKFTFSKSDKNPIQASASNLINATELKQFLIKFAETPDERTLLSGYGVSFASLVVTPIKGASMLIDAFSLETSSNSYQRTLILDAASVGEWKAFDTRKEIDQSSKSRSCFLATHINHDRSIYSLVFKKHHHSKEVTYTLLKAKSEKLHPVVLAKKVTSPKLFAALSFISGNQNDSHWDQKAQRLIISERIRDQEGQKNPVLSMPVKIFSLGF